MKRREEYALIGALVAAIIGAASLMGAFNANSKNGVAPQNHVSAGIGTQQRRALKP